ncbi:Cupin domain protein [Pelosinus fermentans]|uniref:Cupin 2 conserved barrel domain protein n=1 Tax=Pelosinus fermentans B4 TaxID=1149862 RepID=I9B1Q1_9FIRM|nr:MULTISPECIES: cupin domain-containing protein [Pelosinus]EIW19077.1 Cupin 2 conserved barrel domain protein [Pelosinus fermentans B4]OAM95439.1 Cupin 2 conserved barrel domain protein [Pelosinus fermentans DSM 17108]SDR28048.1 Cupin domain protein [Pelosinus fermentans]
MEKKYIKNIEFSKALEMVNLVEYQDGRVVSLTLVQNDTLTLTLFAFAKGEAVSTHSAPGDAMVYILDGEASITVGENKFIATKGQTLVMPSNIPHGLDATENFKMMLILVKG